MSRTYTRAEIVARARFYADMPSTSYVTAAQINELVDVEYAKLWEMLVESGRGYFPVLNQLYTTDGLTDELTLPATCGFVIDVLYRPDDQTLIPLDRITTVESPEYPVSADLAEVYRLSGNYVTLVPRPASGKTYVVRYHAAPSKFTLDADTIDGVAGWEDYLCLGIAVKLCVKEQTRSAELRAMQQEEKERILAGRDKRLLHTPGRVRNVDYPATRPRRVGRLVD